MDKESIGGCRHTACLCCAATRDSAGRRCCSGRRHGRFRQCDRTFPMPPRPQRIMGPC